MQMTSAIYLFVKTFGHFCFCLESVTREVIVEWMRNTKLGWNPEQMEVMLVGRLGILEILVIGFGWTLSLIK